jgi:hypothetical protein
VRDRGGGQVIFCEEDQRWYSQRGIDQDEMVKIK